MFLKIKPFLLVFFVSISLYVKAQVKIEKVNHQDRSHYKVTTPSATYLFDRAGGGFSSIIDKDGLDWVSFQKDSTVATYPKSGGGWYRGLPNAVFGNEDGGCGHPGHDKAVSEKTANNVITTKSKSGLWEWTWTFYKNHAVWNVIKTDPNYVYWLLYEGTIAGSWNNLSDKYWGSDKVLSGKVNDFYKNESVSDLHNWTFFGDKKVNRVLYIAQKNPDEIYDMAGFLGNKVEGMLQSPDGMIVAGLGRDKKGKPAMNQPNSFKIGFIEHKVLNQKQYDKIKKVVEKQNY
jgi:hypothetical protein